MSDLCCNFQIPGSNTVGGVSVTQTLLQCDIVKICISFRGHNSAIMSWIKILFPLCICSKHVCCKFQIPTSNTVGGDAETRTVLQCDGPKYIYVIQGVVILQ